MAKWINVNGTSHKCGDEPKEKGSATIWTLQCRGTYVTGQIVDEPGAVVCPLCQGDDTLSEHVLKYVDDMHKKTGVP